MSAACWLVVGVGIGVVGVMLFVRHISRPIPIRLAAKVSRCAPESQRQRVSGALEIFGARETYSHPEAAQHLRGAHWTAWGSA